MKLSNADEKFVEAVDGSTDYEIGYKSSHANLDPTNIKFYKKIHPTNQTRGLTEPPPLERHKWMSIYSMLYTIDRAVTIHKAQFAVWLLMREIGQESLGRHEKWKSDRAGG